MAEQDATTHLEKLLGSGITAPIARQFIRCAGENPISPHPNSHKVDLATAIRLPKDSWQWAVAQRFNIVANSSQELRARTSHNVQMVLTWRERDMPGARIDFFKGDDLRSQKVVDYIDYGYRFRPNQLPDWRSPRRTTAYLGFEPGLPVENGGSPERDFVQDVLDAVRREVSIYLEDHTPSKRIKLRNILLRDLGLQEPSPTAEAMKNRLRLISGGEVLWHLFQQFTDPASHEVTYRRTDLTPSDTQIPDTLCEKLDFELIGDVTGASLIRSGIPRFSDSDRSAPLLRLVLSGREGFFGQTTIEAYPHMDSPLLGGREIPETMPVGRMEVGWNYLGTDGANRMPKVQAEMVRLSKTDSDFDYGGRYSSSVEASCFAKLDAYFADTYRIYMFGRDSKKSQDLDKVAVDRVVHGIARGFGVVATRAGESLMSRFR